MSNSSLSGRRLVGIAEAVKADNTSRSTVLRKADRGEIVRIRVGARAVRYDLDSIYASHERNIIPAKTPKTSESGV
jgi:hypothetical protein